MGNQDFLAAVASHPRMAVCPPELIPSTTDPTKTYIVAKNGRWRVFEVDPDDILKHSWSELEDVFFGRRTAKLMRHFTRICGYYSEMGGWNRSKLAEHKDRQQGNYRLPEAH